MELGSKVQVVGRTVEGEYGTVEHVASGWVTVRFESDGTYGKYRAKQLQAYVEPERKCGGCGRVLGVDEGLASGLCWDCRGENEDQPEPVKVEQVEEDEHTLPYCACECGFRVRYPGRVFRQGHDQRHKGNLLRAVQRLDSDAAAELLRRAWKSTDEVAYLWDKALAKAGVLVVHEGEASDTPPA